MTIIKKIVPENDVWILSKWVDIRGITHTRYHIHIVILIMGKSGVNEI